jgi:macrolide-specific efflux system membrane fusion protein
MAASRTTVVASVSASGSVRSARSRSLRFDTTGTVERIYVQPGDKVAKGQLLARLDDTTARENLDAASATYDSAAADTSTAALYAQFVKARNALNAAKRAVAATSLKAPFAGTVITLNGTVGAAASGGSTGTADASGGGSTGKAAASDSAAFAEIADASKLQLVGNFTESDVTRLKVGQQTSVTFDALSGVTATGKVTQIEPVASTTGNVVQYPVTVSFTDVPEQVRLGQTATVEVVVGQAENVVAIPSTAISSAGGQDAVTVLRDGRQVRTPVEVGVRGTALTEITSGLTEGDQVVPPAATPGTGQQQQGRFPGGGGFTGGRAPGGVR